MAALLCERGLGEGRGAAEAPDSDRYSDGDECDEDERYDKATKQLDERRPRKFSSPIITRTQRTSGRQQKKQQQRPTTAAEREAWEHVKGMDKSAVTLALEVAVASNDVPYIQLLLRRVGDLDSGRAGFTPHVDSSAAQHHQPSPKQLKQSSAQCGSFCDWLKKGGFSGAVVTALTDDAGAERIEDLAFLDERDLEHLGLSHSARQKLRAAERKYLQEQRSLQVPAKTRFFGSLA